MRTDHGRRTSLLPILRTQLRREIVSAAPPQSEERGGVLPVRQPRSLDAAAQSFLLVARFRSPREGAPRHAFDVRVARVCRRPLVTKKSAEHLDLSRIASRTSLVPLGNAPAVVPESHSVGAQARARAQTAWGRRIGGRDG